MPVDSRAKWRGQGSSRSVNSLPNIAQINASSDFLNQDRGQTMLSELLMHAEEVDFCHDLSFALGCDVDWDSTDEAVESLCFATTDTN